MQQIQQGTGQVTASAPQGDYHLLRPEATLTHYSNAQIQDYAPRHLPHHTPLTLTLQAQFSHPLDQLKGTAGFGFWNAPYNPIRLPKAAWFFFGSPPLDLPLALDVAGNGFKAATMDAATWQFLALLPTAPIGFLLCRIPRLYRLLWPIGQRAIKVSEKSLELDITQWHDYRLEWKLDEVIFSIDGVDVHRSPYSPKGPLGFVAWIDNQYAIITPQGRLGWGLVETSQPQALTIRHLTIT